MTLDHDIQDQRRSRKVGFAVGGVFLLLGVAFAAAMWTGGQQASPEPTQSTDHAAALAALSAPLGVDVPAPAIDVPEPQAAAASALDADAVLAGDGFASSAAGSYGVAAHQAAIRGAGGADFFWHSMPSNVSLEGPSVRTGSDADAAIVEAESALSQVAALWAGAEVQGLLDTVDGAGAEHGVAVPATVRAPLGAGRAVEPDDDAASQASSHADAMLSVVDGGYSGLASGLDRVHAVQSGLPARLDAARADVDAHAERAQSLLDAQREARASYLVEAAASYESSVRAASAAHAEAAVAAREAAVADAQARLDASLDALANATAGAHQDVDAHVAGIQDDADARLAGLDRLEADVRAMTAAGAMDAAEAQALLADIARVRAGVEAQHQAAIQQAAAAHADIDAQAASARDRLEQQAEQTRQEAAAAADEAVAWAMQREAQLLATVPGALQAALAAEAAAHADASARVADAAAAHKDLLRQQALSVVAAAQHEAGKAQRVVAAVQEETAAEVAHDLDIIMAVAEDHRAVPTPERQAAADAWAALHAQLATGLDGELADGARVLAKAEAVLEAAAQAEAAIA